MEWKMRLFFVFEPRPKVELEWVSLPNCWEGEASSPWRSRKGNMQGRVNAGGEANRSRFIPLNDLKPQPRRLVLFDHSAVTNPVHTCASRSWLRACREAYNACQTMLARRGDGSFVSLTETFAQQHSAPVVGLYRWHQKRHWEEKKNFTKDEGCQKKTVK